MQRLIDADKHIEYLTAKQDVCLRFDDVLGAQVYQLAIDEIKGADSIDAEPVVRCKDCKYHIEHKYSPAFYKCKQVSFLKGRLVSSKFGCVLGAKKDEEVENK